MNHQIQSSVLAVTLITGVTLFLAGFTAPLQPGPVSPSDLPAEFSCSLPAPASLHAERTSSTTAYAAWAAVSGAVSYRVVVYNLATLEELSNTVETGTSKNLSGLQAGQTYRCVVAAMCSGGSVSDFVIADDILQ